MTDQNIPANLTSTEAQAVREWAERARAAKVQDETVAHAARVLLAVLPKRPTLADMTPEERGACQWMQADTEKWGRAVILLPDASVDRVMVLDRCGDAIHEDHANVTPRPDLRRMEWPGTEKPASAPALPEGWRLADHKDNGRVIVTNATPINDDRAYYVLPAGDPLGFDWLFCDPAELAYIDAGQGADTPDAVPPNTLAVGSVWDDADALAQACRESELDQIAVTDRNGNASVWDGHRDDWRVSVPHAKSAPFTIIRAGKKADQ